MSVSRLFQGSLKYVSREFNRCVREVSMAFKVFQGSFQSFSRVLQGRLKGVSMESSLRFNHI